MKAYMVTSGEYSAYRINGVYTTEALAEYAKKLYAADDIEEIGLDEFPEHPENCLAYCVAMDRDGNTKEIRHIPADWTMDKEPTIYDESYANVQRPVVTSMAFCVFADDEKGAVKIANERRARLLAENLWPETRDDWNKKKMLYQ